MKLIIIEGLDNVGKDTLINSLLKKYNRSKMVHWGFPLGATNEEKTDYQKTSFDYYMKDYSFQNLSNGLDILIWNRSHIGECVYGPIYRESDPEWIYEMEKAYLLKDNVYLVYLHGDIEFLLKNDDGESFTTDLKKKRREQKAFEKAINKSQIINKLNIKVNDGDNYINKSGILKAVRSFVGI